MIVDTSAIVDITVEELSTVVNLPPGEDPFILYLEEYLRSLLFIVEKIESIKASEKSLRKRIKDGIKLLNSLKGISTPTEDTAQPTEQASTSSPAVTVETAAVIEGISNLADFK
jgi:hypothetical protein